MPAANRNSVVFARGQIDELDLARRVFKVEAERPFGDEDGFILVLMVLEGEPLPWVNGNDFPHIPVGFSPDEF